MTTNPTVVLMLKAPVAGQVKTRLAREIGEAAATQAYRDLVEHQIRHLPAGWPVRICYAPQEAAAAMREWLGERFEYVPQADGNLGQRLAAAMNSHFLSNSSPLIFIGGDCPYITHKMLSEADKKLEEVGAVVVPAADGGYCLIALRKSEEHVFHAIPWSSETVLAETRDRLRESGMSWHETEALEDVDDGPSWQRAVEAFPALARQDTK